MDMLFKKPICEEMWYKKSKCVDVEKNIALNVVIMLNVICMFHKKN